MNFKFIIPLLTIPNAYLTCGERQPGTATIPCSKILKTSPSTYTITNYSDINLTIGIFNAISFGDSTSETIYLMKGSNSDIVKHELPSATTSVINYSPVPGLFLHIVRPNKRSDNYILLSGRSGSSPSYDYKMYKVDISNDQVILNFPNIDQRVGSLDTCYDISRAIFVDAENVNDAVINDFDYTNLMDATRVF